MLYLSYLTSVRLGISVALGLNVFLFLQVGRLTFDPGSKVVQLPYVNYLRELGTTFLNAYTNSPICCPSRAGKLPTKRQRRYPFKLQKYYCI